MSFSLVGPGGGWAFGAKLTSAQMNALDSDHANALDKSVAGDSIAGTVNFTGAGGLVANTVGAITPTISGGIRSGVGGGIESTVASGIVSGIANGITSVAANGITPGVAGGISDGGVSGGIQPTVAGGILSNVAGGIESTILEGIVSGVAGGIMTTAAGGISLAGGSSDWLTYATSRSITKRYSIGGAFASLGSLGTGWEHGYLNGPGVTGLATTTIFIMDLNSLLTGEFNGATLGSLAAQITFFVTTNHTTTAGMTFPRVQIQRWSGVTPTTLYDGTMTSAANPGWTNGGATLSSFLLPNVGGSSVVDTSLYNYALLIQDESGTNSISGNGWLSLNLTFSGITNSGLF